MDLFWNAGEGKTIGGVDLLGLRQVDQDLEAVWVAGVTTISIRARYLSLLAWVFAEHYERQLASDGGAPSSTGTRLRRSSDAWNSSPSRRRPSAPNPTPRGRWASATSRHSSTPPIGLAPLRPDGEPLARAVLVAGDASGWPWNRPRARRRTRPVMGPRNIRNQSVSVFRYTSGRYRSMNRPGDDSGAKP